MVHDWKALTDLRFGIERAFKTAALPNAVDTIIIVGCGERPFEVLFQGNRKSYLGFDLSGDVELPIVPGKSLCINDGSVDGVVSFRVLEHVWDINWYLSECSRILKPGGWLLLSTHGT